MHRTFLALVFALLGGVACSPSSTVLPSPTSPSATPAPAPADPTPAPSFQLAGVWKGFLKITEATRYGLGTTMPFTLRIAGGPQSYTGQLELSQYPAYDVNVGVAGALREDGFAMLSGIANFGALTITSAEVSELLIRTDDTTGVTGTVRFGKRGQGYNERYKAQILSASLQPASAFPGGALEGRWVGMAIIKACSGVCRGLYSPTFTRAIELVLRQSGSTVSGSGMFGSNGCGSPGCWLPLSGTADGQSITSLTGRRTIELFPDGYGDSLMVLSDFSATVDELGRMRAQFVYSSEGQYSLGDPNRPARGASRLSMETLWLTREP